MFPVALYIWVQIIFLLGLWDPSDTTHWNLESLHDSDTNGGTSIYFLETSFLFYAYRKLLLSDRTACAIESAAVHHRNRTVFLVYAAPNLVKGRVRVCSEYLMVLRTYNNIRIVQASAARLIEDTPIEELVLKGDVGRSRFRILHYSDILRVAILMRFGGIYFDNDVMVLRPVDDLGENFVVAETPLTMANGVMGFQERRVASGFLNSYLSRCGKHYVDYCRTCCGPDILTAMVKTLCNTVYPKDVIDRVCAGIKIVGDGKFLAIPAFFWTKFFDSSYADEVLEQIKDSYAIHTWNTFSRDQYTLADPNCVYVLLAKKNCPGSLQKMFDFY